MSTFKYNVAPKSTGGFTTRAVKGAVADQTAILAAIAAEAGITAPQTEAAIKGFFNKVLACAAGCDWSPEFLGMINFRPTSGGSSPAPDGFHNADDINADVALSFTAETIRQWRATLTLESLGEVGKLTPVIETIIRQSDQAVDKYMPGKMIQIRGDRINLDPADPTQGVFFTAGADGAPGEVTTAQLNSAIATTALNPSAVAPLSQTADGSYNPTQMQQVMDKLDELLNATKRA